MPKNPHGPGYVEELDPANQSLAEALRKSFKVLKLLMLVLLVLYFLSGLFSVEQGEVGLVLRFGRIVGTGEGDVARRAIKSPGWHWAWPYPFDQSVAISTQERQIPVDFMFQLSEAEKTSGIKGYRYDNLSPLRDDYLITGDVNVIHASLVVKYYITDAIAYVTNVYEMPDPQANELSAEYRRYPEYTILTNLARNAVVETAARHEALKIRGEDQDAFLKAVALNLGGKLKALDNAGTSLGISIDINTGIISPKKEGVEAIMVPRPTQKAFDDVHTAQQRKSVVITKAQSDKQKLLLETAGPKYERLAEEIEKESDVMRALSAVESAGDHEAEIQALRRALEQQRRTTETLLTTVATGDVRRTLREAESAKDKIIKEAAGDYERFIAVRPEYLRNPAIFISRLLDETYAKALDSEEVAKLYVPPGHKEVRLHIPRSGRPVLKSEKDKKTGAAGPGEFR